MGRVIVICHLIGGRMQLSFKLTRKQRGAKGVFLKMQCLYLIFFCFSISLSLLED